MTVRVKDLFKFLKNKSESIFEKAHNVHVPEQAVTELLDSVYLDNQKILVMFNVEFVIKLVADYNVEPSQITFLSDHVNKDKLINRLNVRSIVDLDNEGYFDLIITAPPFKDEKKKKTTGTRNLWPFFVELGYQHLADNGHMVYITPATWMRKSNDILRKKINGGSKRILTDYFQKNNLKYVNIGDIRRYFRYSNSTFTWWVMQKANYSGFTKIETNGEIINIDIRSLESLPYILDVRAIDIFTKAQQGKDKWQFRSVETFKWEEKSNTSTKDFKYPFLSYKTNETLRRTELGTTLVYCKEKHPLSDSPKIVVPYVGPTTPYVDSGKYGMIHSQVYVLTDGETIDGAKSVMASKMYKFLYSEKMSLHNESGVMNVFVKPDLSRVWTDQELYKFYNLTQDEIDFIEKSL
jgi:sulfur carrier protein ThiS